jgi:hypothetical protein
MACGCMCTNPCVDCLADGQLECKHATRPCANQEAHAWLPVATEEVARLACASGAFTGGPNAQVQGHPLGEVEARSGGGVPCNAQLGW